MSKHFEIVFHFLNFYLCPLKSNSLLIRVPDFSVALAGYRVTSASSWGCFPRAHTARAPPLPPRLCLGRCVPVGPRLRRTGTVGDVCGGRA